MRERGRVREGGEFEKREEVREREESLRKGRKCERRRRV